MKRLESDEEQKKAKETSECEIRLENVLSLCGVDEDGYYFLGVSCECV